MTGRAKQRLARGVAANLFALAARVVVQLASLPVLFAAWPAGQVGTWLTLFAIPAYIALVGNAFAGAGGSAALAAAQAGRWDEARADFRAAWVIAALGTALLAGLFIAGGAPLAERFAGELAGLEAGAARVLFAWLGLYILAVSQTGVLEIAFRVAGRYPSQIVLASLASLGELVVILVAVRAGAGLAGLAMALALARTALCLPATAYAARIAPALFAGRAAALSGSLRRLWRPSLALMVMPLVFGLNLQGYVLLVGASFGVVTVAAFGATRTLVRLLDFVINLAYAVQFYEAGYGAAGKQAQQRRQLATLTLAMLVASAGFALCLLVAGPWLQSLYTMGATRFDRAAAAVLLAAGALRALAATPMALVVADNRHERIIALYLAGSLAGIALAAALAARGAPLAALLAPLVLAEAAQTGPAFAAALRHVGWRWRDLAAALRSPERARDLAAMLGVMRHLR